MPGKLIVVIAALVITLAGPAAAQQDEWIRVGSWNIENLGDRTGQPAKAIAEHIFLSGVDVLTLQEIHDTDHSSTTRTNATLDAVVRILDGIGGNDWDYRLFANKDPSDTSQLVGVAWNTEKLILQGQPFRIGASSAQSQFNLWDREPHAVKFSTSGGGTDFVLIPLHMKSNVGIGDNAQQREEEARALVDRLSAVRTQFGGDQDILILGDTNCVDTNEDALKVYRSAGFRDLNEDDQPTFVFGDAPFDRIFVPTGQQEFFFSRQYNLLSSDRAAHEEHLSDHHLVVTAFRKMTDDDVNP